MRTISFTVCIAWLVLGLTLGSSHARPSTRELANGFRPFPAELPVPHAFARSASRSRDLGIADIPACGIKCMVQYIPQSGCSLTDTLCVCTSAALNQQLSACMLSNCTMADNLGTARVNAELCMLSDESQRSSVIAYTIAVYTVAFTLVALRVAGKVVSTGVAWNDAPIVVAVLLAAVPIACVLAMAKIGFGEHLWNLEDDTFMPILRYFYVAWSTYVAILGLIKLSLIMFYLDVFPTRSFKIAGWIVFWYITLNTLVIFLLTIFACTPVSAFWNRDLRGKCMDIQMLGYANSISAIVQDVILVVLPMCYLRNLQMKKSRKLAVAIMFLIGSFGCITTIVRLRSLLTFKLSVDPTWDYVPVVIWTELEITAAFACVSLPAIRVLLVKLVPTRLKGWLSEVTHGSSHHTPRDVPPKENSFKRNWHKDDTWINLASTEVAGEKHTKDRLGLLPSAETSTSHLKATESRSTCTVSEVRSPNPQSDAGAATDQSSPRTPVSVKSKFSTRK
ncbi:integral membrane protein (CFEM domain-containing protein) [Stagonosporopsis vannaccii]|nr:integral membrane protein (CFEM domain-containing protein) [Stagonosporopsis vannaccii]